MKVVYLTWGETPRSYGVYGSQVLNQFIETFKITEDSEFYFIAGVPIIHSGLVREKISYFDEITKVKKKLSGINFHWLTLFSSQNFVNSNKRTFVLLHFISHYLLKLKLSKIKPDIVHCRSYHAAWAALRVKEKYHLNYKVIFDGRGLWPEEIALKNNYADDTTNYRFLKSIESKNLIKADISVAVSAPMAKHYTELGAENVKTIFLSSATKMLKSSGCESVGNKKNELVFCYVGALSVDTWHKPNELLKLYNHLRHILPNTKLMIVTTSNHDAIRKCFSDIPDDEVLITQTKTVNELKEKLDKADIGLMSYFAPLTSREVTLGSSVLAVKTAEYLAAGLPMLVNSYCGGAAEIVSDHSVGIAYDPSTYQELTSESIKLLLSNTMREKMQNLAYDLFDYKQNAKRYKNMYLELTE